jgi:chemotaxis protein CheC
MRTKDDIAIWTWLVSRGIVNSLSGLSEMVGHELSVTSLDLRQYPAKDAAALLGGPENTVVGIYLTIDGDATGHLMLIHDPKIAFELIDMQMGLPPGSTKKLEEMELSVLGEMGNITGSLFLNALADASGLNLVISPPVVMVDMAGAILGIALTKIMQEQDDVLVIKATFGAGDRQIDGIFMVLPTSEFMDVVLKRPKAESVRMEYHLSNSVQ